MGMSQISSIMMLYTRLVASEFRQNVVTDRITDALSNVSFDSLNLQISFSWQRIDSLRMA